MKREGRGRESTEEEKKWRGGGRESERADGHYNSLDLSLLSTLLLLLLLREEVLLQD